MSKYKCDSQSGVAYLEDHPHLEAMERPFGRGITLVGGLPITMVINHFLPSLKLRAKAPENTPFLPQKEISTSNHQFSGANLLLVSGSGTW